MNEDSARIFLFGFFAFLIGITCLSSQTEKNNVSLDQRCQNTCRMNGAQASKGSAGNCICHDEYGSYDPSRGVSPN